MNKWNARLQRLTSEVGPQRDGVLGLQVGVMQDEAGVLKDMADLVPDAQHHVPIVAQNSEVVHVDIVS